MTDTAVDRADNALRAAHSTDQFGADTLNNFATANSADIADTVDTACPSMDRSRDHTVPEDPERPREANPKVQLPTKSLSSDCPPPKVRLLAPIDSKTSPLLTVITSEKRLLRHFRG
jgi:hypothetical protein